LAPALTAQVNCAYAYAAASHADAWLAEHYQKQNALEQIAFKTPVPALTAQVNCAYAYTAATMPTHGLQSIFKSKML
ncbi:MAG: hypothetical protein R6W92_09980, partial [Desulfocurvibacter africanus]